MTNWQLFGPEHYLKLPWKNGLGYTTELTRETLDDQDFAWRLSIAQVTQDGPFSNFDGYQRTLLLLRGQGLTLEHGDGSRQVLSHSLDAACFAGKGPTSAFLHDGPVEDFNIMTRNGVCSARTHTGTDYREWNQITEARWMLIYAGDETLAVCAGEADSMEVPGAHLLRVDITRPISIRIGGSKYIAIEIFDS